MTWAEVQAKKLADAEAAVEAKHARQLHESRVIETEGPEVFAHLSKRIEESITQINRASGVTRFRIDTTPDGVSIDSVSTPTSSLSLTLNGRSIQIRSLVPSVNPKPNYWQISFRLEANDVVSVSGSLDFEKLADSLLEGFVSDLMAAQR